MPYQDLGEDGPIQLVHGHLGDPMGRSGNMLGPQFDQSAIQEVFTDHDAEMLIVHPDLAARSTGWRRPATNAVSADPTSAPTVAGASRFAADTATAPGFSDAQRGSAVVRVPVYWQVCLSAAHNTCSAAIYLCAQQALVSAPVYVETWCSFCVTHPFGVVPVQR